MTGILFDLDGTLLDTLEDLTDATDHILREFGFPERSAEQVRRAIGNGAANQLRRSAPEGTPEETVERMLTEALEGTGAATWSRPKGGYFVSLYVSDGCAKRTYQLCREAGVVLTNVGATYPYGNDPHDSNIRIAPTFPSMTDLESAMEVLVTCVRLAVLEKCLAETEA